MQIGYEEELGRENNNSSVSIIAAQDEPDFSAPRSEQLQGRARTLCPQGSGHPWPQGSACLWLQSLPKPWPHLALQVLPAARFCPGWVCPPGSAHCQGPWACCRSRAAASHTWDCCGRVSAHLSCSLLNSVLSSQPLSGCVCPAKLSLPSLGTCTPPSPLSLAGLHSLHHIPKFQMGQGLSVPPLPGCAQSKGLSHAQELHSTRGFVSAVDSENPQPLSRSGACL